MKVPWHWRVLFVLQNYMQYLPLLSAAHGDHPGHIPGLT